MKANELRIGNLVEIGRFENGDFHIGRIVGVNEDMMNGNVRIENENRIFLTQQLFPIPLTEEWLLNFGFRDSNGWFGKNGIELFNIRDLYFRGNFPIKSDIKYVHQLQNLYFALTGDELTQVSEGENENFV